MNMKHEIEIKEEPLDGMEYNGTNDQDESCKSDIDLKSEIEIEEDSGLHDWQNPLEEDREEENDVLKRKSSLRSGYQERRGSKGIETHYLKEFSCSDCNFTFGMEDELMSHLESPCKWKVECSQCSWDCNCEANSKVYSLKHSNTDKNILKTKLFKCSEFKCKKYLNVLSLTTNVIINIAYEHIR